MAISVDVVIIGAGLSGLQAAIDLQENNVSFVILEARDRVGGKCCSVQRPDGKGVQELGACWLNDANQPHVWDYVKKFHLTPVVQNVDGMTAFQDIEGRAHSVPSTALPKGQVDAIISLRDAVEATSRDFEMLQPRDRAQLDSLSFEQWCRQRSTCEVAIMTARAWCRGTLGHEPSDVSALGFFEIIHGAGGIVILRSDHKGGAQNLRLKEGTTSIATAMASLLSPDSIKFKSSVTSIKEVHGSYHVFLEHGCQFTARDVIISVPGPAYKNIAFEPPLPSQMQTYTADVRYGCYIKCLSLFRSPWWRISGHCGLVQSFCGPINHCRDTSGDDTGNYALTCFITAAPARKWLLLEEAERHTAVVEQLASLFGETVMKVQNELLDTIITDWMQDKWTGYGCPVAVPSIGTIGNLDSEWWKSTRNGLHYVGTEFTNTWRGYMEGALISGKRGAAEVLKGLPSASQQQ